MKSGTKIKPGTLVKLIDEMPGDPMYQTNMWEDYYYLRDAASFKMSRSAWIKTGEVSLVIGSDHSGIIICNPRGQVGWISKEKMEVVK